jgi:transcription antitermination factor NusG
MRVIENEMEDVQRAPVVKSWYAIYAKHQHEKVVADLLAKKDFDVFLPLYETVHRWKDRTKKVLLPIFPSYLFLRTSLTRRIEVLQTPGVFKIIENCGRAVAVPESEIEAVQRLVSSAVKAEPCSFVQCGDVVRVRTGPLSGLKGTLTRIKNQYRVVVSVELLRQSVSAEVDLDCVDLLERQSESAAYAGMR